MNHSTLMPYERVHNAGFINGRADSRFDMLCTTCADSWPKTLHLNQEGGDARAD